MYIAFGLLIGWQTFGRGMIDYSWDTGDVDIIGDSLLLGDTCSTYGIEPWWVIAFFFTLLSTPLALMEFGVGLKEMLIPGITTYIILMLNEVFDHGCGGYGTQSCTNLPSYINNAVLFFIATNIAYFFDYLYFYPAQNSLIPCILVFAPGASVAVQILNQMGREYNDHDLSGFIAGASDLFANVAMVGVSYALGILLASSYWSIIMAKKDLNGTSESMRKRMLQVYFSYTNNRDVN